MTSIFYDSDQVIADFLLACKLIGIKVTPIQKVQDVVPDFFERIATKEWWASLPLVPTAIPMMKFAMGQQRVVRIITKLPKKNPTDAQLGKEEFFNRLAKNHGFKFDVHYREYEEPKFDSRYCNHGDYLLDDWQKELEEWQKAGGRGWLFHYRVAHYLPANYAMQLQKCIVERKNWGDMEEALV